MPEEIKPNGGDGSGGGTPPAPPQKTAEERFAELEAAQTRQAAQLQSAQEELKRVNGVNQVLMTRLRGTGDGSPAPAGGMDVRNTVKLKRDFSQMDPAQDPARFAQEIVLEAAEQVSEVVRRDRDQQASAASLRTAFYEKNKDLVGHEIVVGHFSNEIQAQNPDMPFDQASELITARTRAYLKERGISPTNSDNPAPPHALPPSSGGNSGPVPIKKPDGTAGDYNPDKAYAEDMRLEMEMRNKERSRSVGIKG